MCCNRTYVMFLACGLSALLVAPHAGAQRSDDKGFPAGVKPGMQRIVVPFEITTAMREMDVPVTLSYQTKDPGRVSVGFFRIDEANQLDNVMNKDLEGKKLGHLGGGKTNALGAGKYFGVFEAEKAASFDFVELTAGEATKAGDPQLIVKLESTPPAPKKGRRFDIVYRLGKNCDIKLHIYDNQGKFVEELFKGPQNAGQDFDAAWVAGGRKSDTYEIRLEASQGAMVRSARMLSTSKRGG